MLNIISKLFKTKKDNEFISEYERISRQNNKLLFQLLEEDEKILETLEARFSKQEG